MKFAAIDVGSNAVRLLLKQVIEDGSPPIFKKDSLIRMPIRLGEDAFANQQISDEKANKLIRSMIGFKYLLEAYDPKDYMACATSALREAKNGAEIVSEIKKVCNIDLQTIDGAREAEIIYNNHAEELLDRNGSYLYIDVGGGSTEITLFSQNHIADSKSFNIGTIRILQGQITKDNWIEMKDWLKQRAGQYPGLTAIGSGGNINKIFRFARLKESRPLTYKKIRQIQKYIAGFSITDRVRILRLRPDRADVIIPAGEIYSSVMKWAKCKKMYVPQIGLSDGIIHMLYDRFKKANN